MLISKKLLSPYVRLSALNIFRRRRMNTERYISRFISNQGLSLNSVIVFLSLQFSVAPRETTFKDSGDNQQVQAALLQQGIDQ